MMQRPKVWLIILGLVLVILSLAWVLGSGKNKAPPSLQLTATSLPVGERSLTAGSALPQLPAKSSAVATAWPILTSATLAPVTTIPAPIKPPPTPIASPTPKPILLRGQITLSGGVSANSRLQVLGKKSSETDYQVWQTIDNPSSGRHSWEHEAGQGEQYQIKVAYQIDKNDVSVTKQVTVKAPRQVNFSLKTNLTLAAPAAGDFFIEPCQRQGETWETFIVINRVADARRYWLQVGDRAGQSNYFDHSQLAPDGGALRLRISGLPHSRSLYARFAYAYCSDCSTKADFSPWSTTKEFTCN